MKNHMPAIGMRIIKSAIAVWICFLFYTLFRHNGIMFYSQLSVLWCIQSQRRDSVSKAVQRTVGTLIGAFYGLIVLILDIKVLSHIDISKGINEIIYGTVVSVFVIAILYTAVVLKKTDAAYFSCVVFLSIVIVHIADANPFIFTMNRFVDTMIGIAIGMLVNNFCLPYRKRKDILFISGVDDTLLNGNNSLSNYSKVEINRMLDDGANFTVATMRTPASLMAPLSGIKLRLPVIAMDGAVLYDTNKHTYLKTYILSKETTGLVREIFDSFNINYFINLLIEDMLIIQYKELVNEAEKSIYDNLHESVYRNYTKEDLTNIANCIYFMAIQKDEIIEAVEQKIKSSSISDKVRISSYKSDDYEGYSYIKIYNKNATRENMHDYLMQGLGLDKKLTFGSIEGKSDVVIKDNDINRVARVLKREYEPVIWRKSSK